MAGKSDNPPPLPQDVFLRVLRVALIDGRLLFCFSAAFAVMAAMGQDVIGAVAGCIAAGAGAMEIHGANRLRDGDLGGVDVLIRSQLLLLGTVLVYVALRLAYPEDIAQSLNTLINHEVREQFAQQGISEDQILDVLTRSYRATCYLVGFVSVLYQGGMALYYHRRRDALRRAIEAM